MSTNLQLAAAVLWIAASTAMCSAAEGPDRLAADKASLAKLQSYIGSWKGVGQPERGSNRGSWIEAADWSWKFADGRAAITFTAPAGKFFRGGEIRPGDKPSDLALLAELPGGGQQRYAGRLEEGRLVLDAVEPHNGLPSRISIRQVAGGDRMLVLLQRVTPGSSLPLRLAEIGYTRQGSGFGQGTTQVECVATGGLGTIPVTHEGKTYYVCCTGCRDLFNDDPEGTLADYRQRKQEEQQKRQQDPK